MPGSTRRIIIRSIAVAGLALYVPLFILVLVWPGIIAKAGKAILVHEVNARVQKLGGLGSAAMEKGAALAEKFNLLKEKAAEEEQKAANVGKIVDAHAEELVRRWVERRAARQASTGKLKSGAGEDESFAEDVARLSPDSAPDDQLTYPSAESTATTDPATDELATTEPETTGSKGRLLRLRSRLRSARDDDRPTSSLEASLLKFAAGSDGLLQHFVAKQRERLGRMEEIIRERYDRTLRELVREARVFTASNILIFGMLYLAAGNPRRIRRLFPVALLLFVVTVVATYFYIFSTNWVLTILHSTYKGWGFLVGVALMMIWLGEAAFVHAIENPTEDAKDPQ